METVRSAQMFHLKNDHLTFWGGSFPGENENYSFIAYCSQIGEIIFNIQITANTQQICNILTVTSVWNTGESVDIYK